MYTFLKALDEKRSNLGGPRCRSFTEKKIGLKGTSPLINPNTFTFSMSEILDFGVQNFIAYLIQTSYAGKLAPSDMLPRSPEGEGKGNPRPGVHQGAARVRWGSALEPQNIQRRTGSHARTARTGKSRTGVFGMEAYGDRKETYSPTPKKKNFLWGRCS